MIIKIIALVSYIAMVVVNYLANGLPLNNRSTGQISNDYPNLFAPAGATFSIWGLIYLLLLGYSIYQFAKKDQKTEEVIKKINPFFIATCLANILWIFSWHYDVIWLSVVLMLSLLFLLIKIADIINKEQFTSQAKLLIYLPFSIYFGWITVATIANITVFLVSISWSGFGIADYVWTSMILLVGAVIGTLRMHKDKNIAYGLVLVWAYFGILLKHLSVEGFNRQYPSIIITIILCLVAFVFFVGKIFYKKLKIK
jgi:hypothetical protein